MTKEEGGQATILRMVEKLWVSQARVEKLETEALVKNNVMQMQIDDCPCNKDKPGSPTLCERCLQLRSAIYGDYWDAGRR